ncbi:hypothetical protein MOV65_23255, partial [Neorhizobium sp. SHOUNA12B]|nr:hypothetical protein [Neorhizobium sp. SHOUNA12B]
WIGFCRQLLGVQFCAISFTCFSLGHPPPGKSLKSRRPVAGGVVAAQTRQVASSYPLETQARPPQGRSVESAYASAPQAKTPQVMFGNMVLEGPKAAQKPVR